ADRSAVGAAAPRLLQCRPLRRAEVMLDALHPAPAPARVSCPSSELDRHDANDTLLAMSRSRSATVAEDRSGRIRWCRHRLAIGRIVVGRQLLLSRHRRWDERVA